MMAEGAKCRVCNTVVEADASACPTCGTPFAAGGTTKPSVAGMVLKAPPTPDVEVPEKLLKELLLVPGMNETQAKVVYQLGVRSLQDFFIHSLGPGNESLARSMATQLKLGRLTRVRRDRVKKIKCQSCGAEVPEDKVRCPICTSPVRETAVRRTYDQVMDSMDDFVGNLKELAKDDADFTTLPDAIKGDMLDLLGSETSVTLPDGLDIDALVAGVDLANAEEMDVDALLAGEDLSEAQAEVGEVIIHDDGTVEDADGVVVDTSVLEPIPGPETTPSAEAGEAEAAADGSAAQPDSPAVGASADAETLDGAVKAGEPEAGEAKVEEPKADEPKADEPEAEEAKADEPKADEPKADEPKADEPKADEPKAEEPKVDEPKVEEPVASETLPTPATGLPPPFDPVVQEEPAPFPEPPPAPGAEISDSASAKTAKKPSKKTAKKPSKKAAKKPSKGELLAKKRALIEQKKSTLRAKLDAWEQQGVPAEVIQELRELLEQDIKAFKAKTIEVLKTYFKGE